jgi:hypothetical protein
MLEQWLTTIRALWPECPARISPDGRSIIVMHTPVVMPARSDRTLDLSQVLKTIHLINPRGDLKQQFRGTTCKMNRTRSRAVHELS